MSIISSLSFVFWFLTYLSAVEARETLEWCDQVLGCLYVTDEWYANKPLCQLPNSRQEIDTRFILQTREAPQDVFIFADDPRTIEASTFNSSRPTKMVTHGFLDNGNKKWIKNLANSLLNHDDYNVIRIDWGGGCNINYFDSSANVRVVGLEVSHFVNTLTELFDLDPSSVHIIGHSLGAHAAGHAGEGISNLGRISGLDPAGPGFTGTDTFVRLDPSDAQFVDTIHTDADIILLLGLGTRQPMGHVSFYPNGGHQQPGCALLELGWIWDWVNGIRDIVACNHQRAVNFFEETLFGNTCQWVAHECIDYETFQQGMCATCAEDNSACAYLGIKANEYVSKERELVNFFINTEEEPMFCQVHYVLEVLTVKHEDAEEWVMGNLHITMYGTNGGIMKSKMITEKHEKITHGTLVRFLFTTDAEIGTILHVELEWNYNDTINPGTFCGLFCNRSLYVKSIQIKPASVYPESDRVAATFLGCTSAATTEMKDRNVVSFLQTEYCTLIPDIEQR